MIVTVTVKEETREHRVAMNLLGVELYGIAFAACPLLFVAVSIRSAQDPLNNTCLLLAVTTLAALFVTSVQALKASLALKMRAACVAPIYVLGLIPLIVLLALGSTLVALPFSAVGMVLATYITAGGALSLLTSIHTINQAHKRRRLSAGVRKLGCGGTHEAQLLPPLLPDGVQLPISDAGTQRSITARKSSTE
jgi:hypothetical protein